MRSGATSERLEPSKSDQHKKIAFVKWGSFSHTNDSVEQELVRCFPEFEVEVIDLVPLIKGNRNIMLRNCLEAAAAFPRDLLTRRRTFREVFYCTGYIFEKIKEY